MSDAPSATISMKPARFQAAKTSRTHARTASLTVVKDRSPKPAIESRVLHFCKRSLIPLHAFRLGIIFQSYRSWWEKKKIIKETKIKSAAVPAVRTAKLYRLHARAAE